MELKDYYFILGVPQTATARDILRAYRERAKRYHPDVAGPQGTAAFQDIVEAYQILSDPERRRHYNHSLSTYLDVSPFASPGGRADLRPEPLIPEQPNYRLSRQPEPLVPEPISLLHDFETMRPSFEALRDHFLRNFTGRGIPKAEGLVSLNADVWLSPYEALRGVVVPVGIPGFVCCTACGGSGRDWLSSCLSCRGQGMVETEHTINVHVPAHVREGDVFEAPLQQMGIQNIFLRRIWSRWRSLNSGRGRRSRRCPCMPGARSRLS